VKIIIYTIQIIFQYEFCSWRGPNYQKWSGSDYTGNKVVSTVYRSLQQQDLQPAEVPQGAEGVPQSTEMIPQTKAGIQPPTEEIPQGKFLVALDSEHVHNPPKQVPKPVHAHNLINPYSPPPHPSPYSPISPYTPQGLTYPQRFFAAEEATPWNRYHQNIHHSSYNVPCYDSCNASCCSHHQDQVFYPTQQLAPYPSLGHYRLGSSGSDGLIASPTQMAAHSLSLVNDLPFISRAPHVHQRPIHDSFTSNEMLMTGNEVYSLAQAQQVQSFSPCQFSNDQLISLSESCVSPDTTTAVISPPIDFIQNPTYLDDNSPIQSEDNKSDLTPVLEELPTMDPTSESLENWCCNV
jgi:hypothetical protein